MGRPRTKKTAEQAKGGNGTGGIGSESKALADPVPLTLVMKIPSVVNPMMVGETEEMV